MLLHGINMDSDTVLVTLKACSMAGDVKTAYDVV
jgi:hypothetical protein